MVIKFNPDGKTNYNLSHKSFISINENTKVALWQVPYDAPFTDIYKRHDSDNSKWLESSNKNNQNEFNTLGAELNAKLDKYKVHVKTTSYNDGSEDIQSEYPNGTKTLEHHENNYVFINIKDKNDRTVAEKVFNYNSNEGRKVIYQNIEKGNDIFTIAKVYSYDTSKNKKTDIVNFGYTSSPSTLTDGCRLEDEYYLLNGEEVEVKTKNGIKYNVKDKNGKKYKFIAE